MSKKNKSVSASAGSPKTSSTVSSSDSPKTTTVPKRRFSRKATILHAASLILMFGVFLFLSVKLNSRTLIARIPVGAYGVIYETTADGQKKSSPFELTASQAIEVAHLIDQTEYCDNKKTEKLAQITIELDKEYRAKFDVTPTGIVRYTGWTRGGFLPPDQVQRILEILLIGSKTNASETPQ